MKLSLKQKQVIIGTNHYIGQFNRLIKEETYGDSASYRILDMWLSEILDLDFKSDIYNNQSVFALSKIDSVKEKLKEKTGGSWFIGDALKDRIYTSCHENAQSEEKIKEMEEHVRSMWAYFKSLNPDVFDVREYIPSGVFLNGTELYMKNPKSIKVEK